LRIDPKRILICYLAFAWRRLQIIEKWHFDATRTEAKRILSIIINQLQLRHF